MTDVLGLFGANARYFEQPMQAAFSATHDIIYFKTLEELRQRRDDLTVLVSKSWPASRGTPRRLGLLQCTGAGLDDIDQSVLPPHCQIGVSPGHEIPMAEFIIYAMLRLVIGGRRLENDFRRGSKQGGAHGGPDFHGELYGRTVLFLGYGGIARETAVRASALGMHVGAVSRSDRGGGALEWSVGWDELDKVLARSDFVVVTCPLTAETKGRIGAGQLAAMKPTAFLINVSRAAIIDEDALYEALAQRRIAGAALDVWYRDPDPADEKWTPATRDFLGLDNVLATAHASAWSENLRGRRSANAVENVRAFLAGRPLPHRASSNSQALRPPAFHPG
jgi:phosphoglycerate dehydrogenase-like enzyme